MTPLTKARVTEESLRQTADAVLANIAEGNQLGSHWTNLLGFRGIDGKTATREQILEVLRDHGTAEEVYINDTYQVHKRDLPEGPMGRMVHLSLRRLDRRPITDWRDKQEIKNQLCGDEAEGVEIYPAESRVVDTANQYHIWVFLDLKLPFGMDAGQPLKTDGRNHHMANAEQREVER